MLRRLAAKTLSSLAMTATPPPLFVALLHQHQARDGSIDAPSSESPCLQTDGVTAETRHLRRLGVGGIGGANMSAVDQSLAAGSPSVPFRAVARGDAPVSGQQRMSTEQDVIAAADESPTTAEWLPQKTP
jgi:hypothetical protein